MDHPIAVLVPNSLAREEEQLRPQFLRLKGEQGIWIGNGFGKLAHGMLPHIRLRPFSYFSKTYCGVQLYETRCPL